MKKLIPLTLLSLAVLLVVALVNLSPPATSASRLAATPRAYSTQVEEEPDKDALYAQMTTLQATIVTLWQQYSQSESQEIRQQIDALQAEFDTISAQLGGDKPVAEEDGTPVSRPPNTVQVVAPVPLGCATTTTTFTASPNIRIPTSGTRGTRSTTINVAGAGSTIWDVDVTTFLTHTAAADLDITLTSPAGTVVTLTTDNGGNLDNVFNGTLWDDQADPDGQLPYSANNGLASDHPYANNALASPLTPEEALGAFIGEDPNGTWTLTISDDALGDIGNLASWSLAITHSNDAPNTVNQVFNSNDENLPILLADDCLPAGGLKTSTLNVSGMGQSLSRLRLRVGIQHFGPDDLDITLTSPSGRIVTISTDNGGLTSNAFDGTTFRNRANLGGAVPYPNCLVIFPCNQGLTTDRVYGFAGTADSLAPEEPLAAFNGENPNGCWTLTINDDSCNLLIGQLKYWSLDVTTANCCQIRCPYNIAVANDEGQCGATVNFYPSVSGGCAVICSPSSGSFFPVGVTTVVCSFMDDGTDPEAECSSYPDPNRTGGEENPSTCSFTVTVNDTEPPQISCSPVVAVGVASSPVGCTTITFATPSATDNCDGVSVVCTPPSGSCFPVGTTTVECVATDASGNTASTFSCPSGSSTIVVRVFDCRLQDDSNPNRLVLFNSLTGDYIFCCDSVTLTGKASKITKKGGEIQLEDNRSDRRVLIKVSKTSFRGTASANQFAPPNFQCQIEDRDTRNDTNICGGTEAMPQSHSR